MKKIIAGFVAFITPAVCFAQTAASEATKGLQDTAKAAGIGGGAPTPLPTLIGQIISILLGLVGMIFLGLMIYAGVKWMLARGDSDAVQTAKDTMVNAVIGMVLIAAAYSLTTFVVSQIENKVSGGGGNTTPTSNTSTGGGGSGSTTTPQPECAIDADCPTGWQCVKSTGQCEQ